MRLYWQLFVSLFDNPLDCDDARSRLRLVELLCAVRIMVRIRIVMSEIDRVILDLVVSVVGHMGVRIHRRLVCSVLLHLHLETNLVLCSHILLKDEKRTRDLVNQLGERQRANVLVFTSKTLTYRFFCSESRARQRCPRTRPISTNLIPGNSFMISGRTSLVKKTYAPLARFGAEGSFGPRLFFLRGRWSSIMTPLASCPGGGT